MFKNGSSSEPRSKSNCWWTFGCKWDESVAIFDENTKETTNGCVLKTTTVDAGGTVIEVSNRKLKKARELFKDLCQADKVANLEDSTPTGALYLEYSSLGRAPSDETNIAYSAETMINFCSEHWDQFNPIGQGVCENISEYLGKASIGSGSFFAPYTGPVFDGPGLKDGANIARNRLDHSISHEKDLRLLAIGWSKFFLSLAAIVAVIALIYAGILYLTDFGSGTGAEKAKKIILWVVVGIILILGSYAIVNTVMKASLDTTAFYDIFFQKHI